MTNYNERFDEILSKLARDTTLADRAADIATTPRAVNDANEAYQWSLGDAKQAITSLIKELVTEAKPEPTKYEKYNSDCLEGFNIATDEFEQNLLKALESKSE